MEHDFPMKQKKFKLCLIDYSFSLINIIQGRKPLNNEPLLSMYCGTAHFLLKSARVTNELRYMKIYCLYFVLDICKEMKILLLRKWKIVNVWRDGMSHFCFRFGFTYRYDMLLDYQHVTCIFFYPLFDYSIMSN